MKSLTISSAPTGYTLSTLLILVVVVGVLATIFFPTIVGHVREGDVPAAPELYSAPALQQPHVRPSPVPVGHVRAYVG